MPDENRFAGLGDQVDNETPDSNDTDGKAPGSAMAADAGNETENEPTSEDADGGPAFGFDATTAKSIYVRQTTLDVLDDTEFEVESVLRREHDIRNVTGREFHDTMIHLSAEYVDELAERIQAARDNELSGDTTASE
jgi:hypothetical protein